MTLGEQIKQAREAKNLSQEDLAAQLEVSRQAVSKWENGNAKPQGINKEMLTQILDLDFCSEETSGMEKNKINIGTSLGLIAVTIFAILLIVIITTLLSDKNSPPSIKSITFYDNNQNEVLPVALWYNSAQIESILIQWEGGTPDNIKMFATPSGTETMDETELLLTKSILDGDSVTLLDADSLKNKFQTHVFFQLDFGTNIITSDIYNVFYDETIIQESKNTNSYWDN